MTSGTSPTTTPTTMRRWAQGAGVATPCSLARHDARPSRSGLHQPRQPLGDRVLGRLPARHPAGVHREVDDLVRVQPPGAVLRDHAEERLDGHAPVRFARHRDPWERSRGGCALLQPRSLAVRCRTVAPEHHVRRRLALEHGTEFGRRDPLGRAPETGSTSIFTCAPFASDFSLLMSEKIAKRAAASYLTPEKSCEHTCRRAQTATAARLRRGGRQPPADWSFR